MNKKVLVTGANGHLGAHTIRSLLNKGYSVRALVRKNADLRSISDLPVELYYGNVLDLQSMVFAALDCQSIIHHAAVYKMWARNIEEIMSPAVEGTRNIIKAAAKSRVNRLVYTSSTFAIGLSDRPDEILTAKHWNLDSHIAYGRAKAQSEKLAWALAHKYNVPMISLCPGAIFGSLDYRVTPSNRILLDMVAGKGKTMEGEIPFIDARDAGELHALALAKGTPGKRYILVGNTMKFKELGNLVQSLTGTKVSHLNTSRRINILIAQVMETICRITRSEPPLTADLVREVSHQYAQYDDSDIRQDFGYKYLSPEETVKEATRWYVSLKAKGIRPDIQKRYPPKAALAKSFTLGRDSLHKSDLVT